MSSPIVRQIVGRCHVADSYGEVIRYVISRMAHGHKSFKAQSKANRRALLRNIIREHKDNRKLYAYVMNGLR